MLSMTVNNGTVLPVENFHVSEEIIRLMLWDSYTDSQLISAQQTCPLTIVDGLYRADITVGDSTGVVEVLHRSVGNKTYL